MMICPDFYVVNTHVVSFPKNNLILTQKQVEKYFF